MGKMYSLTNSRVTLMLLYIVIAWTRTTVTLVTSTSNDSRLSLYIDKNQIKEYSGYEMDIPVIFDGIVMSYVREPNFEKTLPVIPYEVSSVNFTWSTGFSQSYYYNFDQLTSFNTSILANPYVTIAKEGKIPRKPSIFSIGLPCNGNVSGIVSFAFGLQIYNEQRMPLPHTPLRFKLQKQCRFRGNDPKCDRNCANGGWCREDKTCECPKGYIGHNCASALCYPVCMNGGICIAPGQCSCSPGFQGPHCEGGICQRKCLNGGKCIQKDTCECRSGYYGPRCEYSKCLIPCLNRGRCVGVNRCRCTKYFTGLQCEIQLPGYTQETTRRNRRRKEKYV